MHPYEVPREIASGEGGETNSVSAVSQEKLLAVDRSHCSSSLIYLTASFVKLLSCCVQFLHFSREVTVDPCEPEVPPKRHEIASGEGQTSSAAISKKDHEVFSGKATVDPCEVPPKRRKMDFEKGETSSSSISKNDYEVFLSFRGPDTRQGLTDNIYHALVDAGIRVFRDDDELALGDKIDEILTALDNSKICVVVLSPKFAESAWCLREVERMVEKKKDIVPIFCHVSPDDVKLKTGSYAGDLMVHQAKHGKERVQLWREALKEIPTIKGRELKNTGFVEFSRKIAKEILTKLKVKHMYEIQNFVQVEDDVEAALKLLDTDSGGCQFLAIHGMGGIGKTTLAKVIFNQIFDSFDCSCFLENIRDEVSKGSLPKLQEQLLRSLDPSLRDAAQIFGAIGKIKNNFTRKKVLIVLDDIDDKNHIRDLVGSFGSGSRIILTSRNAELHEQGTSSDAHFYGFEKKEMDSKQALKLFSRHAFGGDSPPKDFESLSTEAISTTGGLPLALEVVGSFLHRRKAKVWRDMIKKLKEAPHHDVLARLKISYDALEDEQQEIFLDIACFFIGEEKRKAVYMWEACDFDPNYGIEVLISMSLIKLKKDNIYYWMDKPKEKKCFWMHDQLRDLGRAIVKVNSKDDRAGSRLWRHKEAIDLLEKKVGKEKVEAIHLSSGSLDLENFIGLEKLRFLRLTNSADLGGDFGGLIPNLRWLSLHDVPSFTVFNFCLRELVVLELSRCNFDNTWQGWGQIMILEQLKVLTVTGYYHCNMLDLSKLVNLRQLVLKNSWNYWSYRSLNFSNLLNLSLLEIEDDHFSTGSLVLTGIEQLIKLKVLSIRSNCVGSLSMEWAELRQLKSLTLQCEYLEFGQCRLPWSLESLELTVKEWGQLPINLSSLKNLSALKLGNFVIEEEDSFEGLDSLECLDMALCIVKFIDFSVFKSLRKLVIGSPVLLDQESEDGEALKLRTLKLINFLMHEVKEDECSISEFFANNVSVLQSLTSLDIRGYAFPKMTCLHIPPQLNCLVELNIGQCSEVVYIQGLGKLKSLKTLRIDRCDSLRKIGDLFELKGPLSIDIYYCSNFEGIDGVDTLLSTGTLSRLWIEDCKCESVDYARPDDN